MSTIAHAFIRHLSSHLLPPVCALCRRAFLPTAVQRVLCADCFTTAFPPSVRCIQCGLALGPRLQTFGWTRCRHCRAKPDDSRTTIVAADYRAPFDSLPKRLKFNGDLALADVMGAALAQTIGTQARAWPDCLTPVPVSARRLRERGYNQAGRIASAVGRALKLPVSHTLLCKTRDTQRQADLSALERQANLDGAIVCSQTITGLHIGLVDDVMTTGATLAVCEAVLMEAGAQAVTRLVAFRTPEKPEDPPD